jgi:beta-lactamase regulating signal transducer with metallopeptidase domain
MFLVILQNSSLVENLAWTLLHSVWQIGFAAILLFLVLRFISRSNANLRYFVSVSALTFALILPIGTFFYVSQLSFQTSDKQMISANTSDRILQKQFENLEEYSLTGKVVSDTTNIKTTSSVNAWQDNLTTTFSTLSPFLVAFWLIGILLFSLRFIGGFWQLHLYKTRQVSELNLEWQVRFAELCGKLNVNQCVEILQSNLVTSPMVIGWLKPVILIPASVFLQMDIRQLETIIAHELLHIKRFDYLINFAQSFIEILFFYHPCIWWISTKIRQERECACDDAVLQTLENAQFTYANALANLEAFRLTAKQNKPQLKVAANGGKLMNRIERIVNKEKTKKSRFQNSLWSASLASMLILAFLVTVFWANSSLDVKQIMKFKSNNQKKIAVGFIIASSNSIFEDETKPDETIPLLAKKLNQYEIPAIGFVQGFKVYNKDSKNYPADYYKLIPPKTTSVRAWRDAGFEVGIGSYSNLKFSETNFEDYVADAKKNIELVKPILSENNRQLRYFSYQFPNTENNFESKIQFEQWLAGQNLRSVPITFDNLDFFSRIYDVSKKLDNPEAAMRSKKNISSIWKS